MTFIRTSFASELTTAPNAAPMMIPTARSTMFPRNANSLNSLRTPLIMRSPSQANGRDSCPTEGACKGFARSEERAGGDAELGLGGGAGHEVGGEHLLHPGAEGHGGAGPPVEAAEVGEGDGLAPEVPDPVGVLAVVHLGQQGDEVVQRHRGDDRALQSRW